MSFLRIARQGLLTAGALAALALGASAVAGAASGGSSSSAAQGTNAPAQQRGVPAGSLDPTKPGGHVGANGQSEQALPAGVAAKVKEAASAKVSGTVLRVETDVDHGSPFEAHIRKSDGTEVEVLVDKGFQVTAVNTMRHP